jgi:ligand-binding sensor domain-containing protein
MEREGMRRFAVSSVIAAVVLLSTTFDSLAQRQDWRNYTSMNNARDAIQRSTVTYVITSGGMYGFTNDGEIIETLTPIDGLSAIDLTALTLDQDGRIWTGASSGMLDGYDPATGMWINVADISRADFPRRDITALAARGDTIFVGTSFGVSVYSIGRNEFNDSFIKFGTFPTQTPVTAVTWDEEYIWVGTASGIARGVLHDPLLAAPDRWTVIATANPVTDIVIADGVPFAAAGDSVYWYDGQVWSTIAGLGGVNVRTLAYHNSSVYAGTAREVYTIDESGIQSQYGPQLPGDLNSIAIANSGILCLVDRHGAVRLENDEWRSIVPGGPTSNHFIRLEMGIDGSLWAGTGTGGNGVGFYHFMPDADEEEQWAIYTEAAYPEIPTDDSEGIFTASDGSVWIGTGGRGIIRFSPDGTIRTYDHEDGLGGLATSPEFIVVGKAGEDSRGTIWFGQLNTFDRRTLVRLDPETNEVESYRNDHTPGAYALRHVIVDRNDTKWIVSIRDQGQGGEFGLFYYNEELSVGTNINGWGRITTVHGLPSNIVNAIVEDTRGEIWVGTEAGLAAIVNLREPQASVRDIGVLQDQFVTTIAVDPLNRKWVGTNEGVFVVSPDGTSLIEHFSTQNTNNRLLSNEIKSIAFDTESGTAYIGTERGLSSITTIAAAPRTSMNDLFVAPNPFSVPAEFELKIDGLARNSSIKILSVDGRLVRSFSSPGGRIAHWDGRDEAGRHVASGVYIVVGYSEDGSEVGKAKVTVIRR